MRRLLPILALTLAAAGPPGAESCTGCHIPGNGIPMLHGRRAQDTIDKLEAFRAGTLPATLMNRIVKGFTPEEVRALATWFAAPSPVGRGPG